MRAWEEAIGLFQSRRIDRMEHGTMGRWDGGQGRGRKAEPDKLLGH